MFQIWHLNVPHTEKLDMSYNLKSLKHVSLNWIFTSKCGNIYKLLFILLDATEPNCSVLTS